jgi:hypothetical protein
MYKKTRMGSIHLVIVATMKSGCVILEVGLCQTRDQAGKTPSADRMDGISDNPCTDLYTIVKEHPTAQKRVLKTEFVILSFPKPKRQRAMPTDICN